MCVCVLISACVLFGLVLQFGRLRSDNFIMALGLTSLLVTDVITTDHGFEKVPDELQAWVSDEIGDRPSESVLDLHEDFNMIRTLSEISRAKLSTGCSLALWKVALTNPQVVSLHAIHGYTCI